MLRAWAAPFAIATLLACSGAPEGAGSRRPDGARGDRPADGPSAERAAPAGDVAAGAPASAAPALPPFTSATPVDLWIKGGTVVDGTGAPARAADVVVRGDRIEWVGPVAPGLVAKTTVDATGKLVTPGFVDMHAHGDPLSDGKILLAQGVTTIVLGQDGKSAPNPKVMLDDVDRGSARVNVATLYGHATARVEARLPVGRAPSAAELERLSAKVARAMDDGAFGLSTGLEYEPGSLAGPDELAAAAAPVGERGGLVMSHLRSEDDDAILASLDELFDQCRRGKARAHVSHLKIVLGRGEARARAVLDHLAAARRGGLPVTADLYPYTASYTSTGILFPAWAKPPNSFSRAKKERRAELLTALRDKVNLRGGPEKTLFGTGDYAGKTLAEIASRSKLSFEEVLMDVGPGGASAAYFVMDDDVVRALFRDPFVSIGTDGGGGLHPRNAGTFAKILGGYVRDEKLVPLEEGIRKMSGLAMETLGVSDRGTIVAGAGADLLVFQLGAIRDRASFAMPFAPSEGMSVVVVGGVVEWRDGKPIAGHGGRALRRGRPTVSAQ